MTTRREFERQCWSALSIYMNSATVGEFLAPVNLDVGAMSDAEFERFSRAYERVMDQLDQRAAVAAVRKTLR